MNTDNKQYVYRVCKTGELEALTIQGWEYVGFKEEPSSNPRACGP